MSSILERLSRSEYVVEYFVDEDARRVFDETREPFEDYSAAEARAAELGKTLRWVKFIRQNFADNDTHLGAFGTDVTHESDFQRNDRRGAYHCGCGMWVKDIAALDRHYALAGWQRIDVDVLTREIDAINARLRWPGSRPDPCAGHMVSEPQTIEGIDVTRSDTLVKFQVAGMVVATGNPWTGIGNASVCCLLSHDSYGDRWVTALHQGGAINAFQYHLLVSHGTHAHYCQSFRRELRCRICREGNA